MQCGRLGVYHRVQDFMAKDIVRSTSIVGTNTHQKLKNPKQPEMSTWLLGIVGLRTSRSCFGLAGNSTQGDTNPMIFATEYASGWHRSKNTSGELKP